MRCGRSPPALPICLSPTAPQIFRTSAGLPRRGGPPWIIARSSWPADRVAMADGLRRYAEVELPPLKASCMPMRSRGSLSSVPDRALSGSAWPAS